MSRAGGSDRATAALALRRLGMSSADTTDRTLPDGEEEGALDVLEPSLDEAATWREQLVQ